MISLIARLVFAAVMKVSRDFFVYKSGVYKCSNVAAGSRTGYHSVRIVGWGEEYQNGRIVKYWVIIPRRELMTPFIVYTTCEITLLRRKNKHCFYSAENDPTLATGA